MRTRLITSSEEVNYRLSQNTGLVVKIKKHRLKEEKMQNHKKVLLEG